ncbi:hypothetical protein [Thioclava sp.]|uniref:hypothetical protein n=1 Tax=Thioclava sp. TaxID=1933450 RepID=UPI003AA88FDB
MTQSMFGNIFNHRKLPQSATQSYFPYAFLKGPLRLMANGPISRLARLFSMTTTHIAMKRHEDGLSCDNHDATSGGSFDLSREDRQHRGASALSVLRMEQPTV